MAAGFRLTLDTTAPSLTWGGVTGAVASEELVVGYTVTETGVADASIALRDGRTLPMAVAADRLTVTLPDDAQDGDATITAHLRDDVGNAATATLIVAIVGSTGPPPSPPVPVGGPGSPARAPGRLVRFEPSTARASSGYGQTAVWSSASVAFASSRYTQPTSRMETWGALAFASSRYSLTAGVSTRSGGKLDGQWTVTKRPEGPDTEAALLALGLL